MRAIRSPFLQAAVLVLVAAGLFSPTLAFDFALDDPLVTTQNALVGAEHPDWLGFFLSPLYEGTSYVKAGGDLYRPVPKLSMALNRRLAGGFDPRWFHLGNVVIFSATVLAAFLFYRSIFSDEGGAGAGDRGRAGTAAFLATALFAAFPSHVESVAGIKHREELLACAFGLVAWTALLRGSRSHRPLAWGGAGAASFLLALLSKESAALLLPCMVAWEAVQGRLRKAAGPLAMLGVAAVAYALLRRAALGAFLSPASADTFFTADEGLFFRAGVASVVFLKYYLLDQLVMLRLDPAFSSRILLLAGHHATLGALALLAMAGVAAASAWATARRHLIAAWPLFFLASAFLATNVVRIGTAGAFRLMFTPSVFLCGFIAALLVRAHGRLAAGDGRAAGPAAAARRWAVPVLATSLVLVYASVARIRLPAWRNDGTLFSYSSSLDDSNALSSYAAAQYFERRGDAAAKEAMMLRALEAFLRVQGEPRLFDERSLDAFSIVATEAAYASIQRDPARALELASTATAQFERLRVLRGGRVDTNATAPYYVQGLTLRRLGRTSEAAAACRTGLALADHAGLRQLLAELSRGPFPPGATRGP